MAMSHNYRLQYTEDAIENLRNLEKNIARRIMKKLDFFVQTPDPLNFAKHLTDFRG